MDSHELMKYRNNKVVKSNILIQKSRHHFSVQQQKALLFLISQLKPEQDEFEWQTFDIIEFCEVCGIGTDGGKTYRDLKESLQGLRDKSMWLTLADGTQSLVGWLNKVQIRPKSGKIAVRFDEEMKPLLLELQERYTQFELKYTLAMRSKYAVRLYEILKSYAEMAKDEPIEFTLERFKALVGAEYNLWYDLKRKVVEVAIKEINEFSDLFVTYEAKKKGRAYTKISFTITVEDSFHERMETSKAINARLNKSLAADRQPAAAPGGNKT